MTEIENTERERDQGVSDLAAAQQLIAELEEIKNRQALHITHLVMQLRGHDWSYEVVATRARIAELEQHVDAAGRELKLQYAALRAIAPVYRAAEGQRMAVETWGNEGAAAVELLRATSTARARLTPELLAVIEAATK
jgi:phosphosulfolactate phosphohydrolase-like enzyme